MNYYILDRENDEIIKNEDGEIIVFKNQDEIYRYLSKDCQYNYEWIEKNYFAMRGQKVLKVDDAIYEALIDSSLDQKKKSCPYYNEAYDNKCDKDDCSCDIFGIDSKKSTDDIQEILKANESPDSNQDDQDELWNDAYSMLYENDMEKLKSKYTITKK